MTLGPLHGAGAFKVRHQKVKFNFLACIGSGSVAAQPAEGCGSDTEQFLNLAFQRTGSLRFLPPGTHMSQGD